MYIRWMKRTIDFCLSLTGLILLSPVLAALSLWIQLDSKGPVFFKQKRFGKDHSYFYIYKFRTMRIDTPKDQPTHLLENPDQYITRSGRFLRKTSLDELPQLINILKGEMSLIGPRPALWNQYDLMDMRSENGSSRCRPGLSGWAQIHGRDEIPVTQKAALDGYYADHVSFGMDIRCLFGTILPVLLQKGFQEGVSEKKQYCSYEPIRSSDRKENEDRIIEMKVSETSV